MATMDDFAELAQHLSEDARTSLFYADSIARGYGSPFIGTEHLLLGILSQNASVAAQVLADAGLTLDKAEMALGLTPTATRMRIGVNVLSEASKVTLQMSWETARRYHQDELGTEHILYSLLRQPRSRARKLLAETLLLSVPDIMADLEAFFTRREQPAAAEASAPAESDTHVVLPAILKQFGTDITQRARDKKLDPVIGRQEEIKRMAVILSRRSKNNPVLIGEPGVGKTAIVEGLAQRIVAGDVPPSLQDKQIVQLDLARMIAGTKYRGEFEERLNKVTQALAAQPHIIAFIDEIHMMMGAGAAEGALDAANVLKPALARHNVRIIGATTVDEYKKHIEKDTALERRLQAILVKEPKLSDVMAMLKGMRQQYEQHHQVRITDEVIDAVVQLADRYITQRFMPDKALDVLDEAAAYVRVTKGGGSEIVAVQKNIAKIDAVIAQAAEAEDYQQAAAYKTRRAQLDERRQTLQKKQSRRQSIRLTPDDIARAVAQMAGIPVGKVHASERRLLMQLERQLGKRIIGQAEAVQQVAKAVRRGRSGINQANRPIGSFVFMGPTGVGKTELARVLAEEVFGSKDALVKIDMSELAEKHTTSRLLGASAGYVGYDDGGQLTDTIRRQPYSVVLFDEIEKAHPDVLHILLQILEDGVVSDSKGRQVSFRHTILILTSNIGADAMQQTAELGFRITTSNSDAQLEAAHQAQAATARKQLEKRLRPELINRLNDVIVFRPLTQAEAGRIFDLLVADLKKRLASQGLLLQLTPRVKKLLVAKGYDSRYGARPMRRVIETELEHPIAEGILAGDYQAGSVLTARASKGIVTVQADHE